MTATIAPFDPERNTDTVLPLLVRKTNSSIVVHNDDAFFLIVGDTGTGKSMLSLHIYEAAVPNPNIQQIAFDPPTMAQAMKNILDLPRGERVLAYDEAFVSSRNSLSKFNKDVLELYSKIRGENVLHLWSTPSAQQVDKAILFERVKAVFFVYTKTVNKPRLYAFFTRTAIKRIYEREGNVEHDALRKNIMKEASYIGAFRDYKGVLRSAYDARKEERQGIAINEFSAKYLAAEGKTIADVCRILGCDDEPLRKRIRDGTQAGELVEGKDYVVKGTKTLFLETGIKYLKEALRNRHKRLVLPPSPPARRPNPISARKGGKSSS